MTNEEYHQHKAISASQLKWLAEDESEFIYKMFAPKLGPTPAMLLGTEFHTQIENLLTDGIKKDFTSFEDAELQAFGDNPNRRLKNYQEWKKANQDLPSKNAYDMAKAIYFSKPVQKGIIGRELIQEESYFQSFTILDGKNKYQVETRCRPDLYIQSQAHIIDWKSINKIPTERVMHYEINDRRYWVQVGTYAKIMRALGFPVENFTFAFVKSSAPYQVGFTKFLKEDVDTCIRYVDFLLLQAVKILQGEIKPEIYTAFAPGIYPPRGYES